MRLITIAVAIATFVFPGITFGLPKHKGHADKDTVQHIALDTLEVSATSAPKAYQATSPIVWDIVHTKIGIQFNFQQRTAPVREWITLHPVGYPTDSLTLDAKSMVVDSVVLTGKHGTPLSFTYHNDQLRIRLNRIYQITDTLTLYLKYTATPYAQSAKGSAAITEDRGLYFINTDATNPYKPAQIWTQGETESNSHWMVTIDKPNSRFTTEIAITVADTMVTLSSGRLASQKKGKDGLRTDTWKTEQPITAYTVMMAIGKFSIVKNKWRGKEVNYYTEPEYAKYASQMFNNTAEMMECFSQKTGVPYPWNKYSQVVVRDYVSGAMENTSASLFGEFMNMDKWEIADKNNEDVVAHELFHQWFGDYVTCESWSNLTVNESFANYGEQLWRTYKYGKASADELAYNDLQRYLYSSYVKDPQLVRFHYDNREQMFDAVTYTKGGAILRYLHTLVGDAAFERAMRIYLTKNALQPAEAHNWRMAVEEATGQDWNWFFNQWYYHAGHPEIAINYVYNDEDGILTVQVKQTQTDSNFVYQLPLKAAIINGNEVVTTDWLLNKRIMQFKYPYINGIRPVVVPDVAHVLPGKIKDNKAPNEWRAQYFNTTDLVSKLLCVKNVNNQMADTHSLAIYKAALSDTLLLIRNTALTLLKGQEKETVRDYFRGKIRKMAETDKQKQIRGLAMSVLGAWETDNIKPLLYSALHDSSYALAAYALQTLYRINHAEGYLEAKGVLKTRHPKATLDDTIWDIISDTSTDSDISIYEDWAIRKMGIKKLSFTQSLNEYMKNVKDDSSWMRAVSLMYTITGYETLTATRNTDIGYLFSLAASLQEQSKTKKEGVKPVELDRLAYLKPMLQASILREKDETIKNRYEAKWQLLFEK